LKLCSSIVQKAKRPARQKRKRSKIILSYIKLVDESLPA